MTMRNPYRDLPGTSFWRRAVSEPAPEAVDPVTDVPFAIAPADKVATAGSCFAQHISRTLVRQGFRYLVTEPEPAGGGENYGVYPARFGNVYTVRQLLQLFERAYGMFEPLDAAWRMPNGAWVDPFRPQIQAAGYPTLEALEADRARHLAAVREMFETCDVFVYTLGLTEGWYSTRDGAVFPLAPGVVAEPEGGREEDYAFANFGVVDMATELNTFVTMLRSVNPTVRVILTVSPVSLIATYEPRHVLVSTIYSKSALRVVAEEVVMAQPNVAYFPSFEIITGHHNHYRFFEPDLRSVTPEGVKHVMSIFSRHFLAADGAAPPTRAAAPPRPRAPAHRAPAIRPTLAGAPRVVADLEELNQTVCDEEVLEKAEQARG
ncbi:GSCFA domain-containing protein [Falsiroseomonas ponticola]|uniref:GSCFA domain-containing protein n=1 Tax=Falsiroseomonas ponticola TaxID=2786951 RepID=UPI0019314D81|nr:GSCFA domain-containing protein [Roseomonas ponticola]